MFSPRSLNGWLYSWVDQQTRKRLNWKAKLIQQRIEVNARLFEFRQNKSFEIKNCKRAAAAASLEWSTNFAFLSKPSNNSALWTRNMSNTRWGLGIQRNINFVWAPARYNSQFTFCPPSPSLSVPLCQGERVAPSELNFHRETAAAKATRTKYITRDTTQWVSLLWRRTLIPSILGGWTGWTWEGEKSRTLFRVHINSLPLVSVTSEYNTELEYSRQYGDENN